METGSSLTGSPSSGDGASTVLIAEDNVEARQAMRELFAACGYRVVVARNGREAVERSLECHPDIILMDLMMPELDGFMATREIRRGGMRDVPIIALTAMDGVARLVLEAGANDYLRKPVKGHGLIAKVEEWTTDLKT